MLNTSSTVFESMTQPSSPSTSPIDIELSASNLEIVLGFVYFSPALLKAKTCDPVSHGKQRLADDDISKLYVFADNLDCHTPRPVLLGRLANTEGDFGKFQTGLALATKLDDVTLLLAIIRDMEAWVLRDNSLWHVVNQLKPE